MPEFSYEAANAEGRMMKGQISAGSLREAQRSLRAQGLAPVEIGLATTRAKPKRAPKKKSGRQDQILVMGELAVLLDAGVALAEAVKSLGHSDLPLDLAQAFDQIERGLRQGQRFSTALKAHLPMLPSYVHQLVAAGEMTGQLAEALRDGSAQMDYDYRVLQDIRNALVYPSVLVGAGVTAVLFIFIVVVPRFAAMFQSARIEIPMLSKIVLTIGLFTRDHLLELGMGFGLFVIIVLMLSRRPAVRAAAMEVAPKLPLFGGWLDETEVGRWAAMLSILLRNKIPLIQALELSRSGLRVPSVRDRMSQVEKAVRGGRSLADALAAHTDMMPIGLNLVRIGERAGNLPEMLKSLAALNERSAKDRMKRFLLVIEPLAIIIIGAVIGLIVTAIMLAVTSISNIQI